MYNNYMKKIVILLLLIIMHPTICWSEDFPPRGEGIHISSETNPIYWGYLEDYAVLLKKAFENKKMFKHRGWGADYEFILTRNGEIKNLKVSYPQNNYYDNKVKEIILSVKPLPFRDGMNLEYMRFSVYLSIQRYERTQISIGGHTKDKDKRFTVIVTIKR